MVDTTIELLIDASTRKWNHELIDKIFISEEADLIKKMPLARLEVNDSIFWPLTQKGELQASRFPLSKGRS